MKETGVFLRGELSPLATLDLGKTIGDAEFFEDLDVVELSFCGLLPALLALDLGGLGR